MNRFYHPGMRVLQDHFDSRRLADHFAATIVTEALNEDQQAFIRLQDCFFLATADASGAPDCSYKGGVPGFVQVLDEQTLVFPDYDGNGMFRSLGNIEDNPRVGMLFIDTSSPRRLRINGRATVYREHPRMASLPGARLVVQVVTEAVFPNCPRYIHPVRDQALSPHAPREGHTPPDAEWKQRPERRAVLPHAGPAGTTPEKE